MVSIELLWQTKDAIAINKPAGIATQAPPPYTSVESLLREQLHRVDDYLAFPHRLDRSVGGILLVALTKRAANLLSGQFASRKTAKEYVAVVHGRMQLDQPLARWNDWIRKVDRQPRAEPCQPTDANAKEAITDATTLSVDEASERTRLKLQPFTGRMHQLRIQCAMRNHPIVGDDWYGAQSMEIAKDSQEMSPGQGEAKRRILLHASRLAFHDPSTGRRLELTAPCEF